MRKTISMMFAGFIIASAFPFIIEFSSFNASASSKTWNQTSGNLASTDANWVGGLAPVAGDAAVFDGTSTVACTWDLAITLSTFNINSGYTGVVTLSTDFGTSGNCVIAAGTLTGGLHTITCAGNFEHSAGTISTNTLVLTLIGDANTMWAKNTQFHALNIEGNITEITNSCTAKEVFSVASGKTFTISSGLSMYVYLIGAGSTYTNSGTITGGTTSYLRIIIGGVGFNPTVTFGTVTTTYVEVKTFSGAGASTTLSLGSNTDLMGFLNIYSDDAVRTTTLDVTANNYSLTAIGITIGTRGILNARGSLITSSGSWDSSAGVYTEGTSRVILNGNGHTIKTASGSSFYDLEVMGRFSLTSSANVSHDMTINDGKMITIGSGKEFSYACTATGTYSNSGTIAGSGTLTFSFDSADKSIAFGTIATNLTWIWAKSTSTANRTLTMTGSSLFCGSLLLNSSHALNWMIFDTRAGDVTVRNTFTNGTRGMVLYTNPWTILNLSMGSYSYQYQINSAGDAYYVQNMLTGLIELTDIDYSDNVTQYAIDNSLTNAEVNFANGTYIFRLSHDFYVGGWNCSIYLNTTFNLTISGSGSTILKYRDGLEVASGKGSAIFLFNDQSETTTVRELEFQPGTDVDSDYASAFFFYHPTGARPGFRNVTIENCTFNELDPTWGDGMYYYGVNNRFINNIFDTADLQFHNTPSQVLISGNSFIGSQVWLDSTSNVTISNNTFTAFPGSDVFMYDGVKWTHIQDNTFVGTSLVDTSAVQLFQQSGKPDCENTTIIRNAFTTFKWVVRLDAANETMVQNNSFLSVINPILDYANGTFVVNNTNYSYGPSFGSTVTLAWNYVQFDDGWRMGVIAPITWVNITLDSENSRSKEWTTDTGGSEVNVTYSLSELNDYAYKVKQNGTLFSTDDGPAFSFTSNFTGQYTLLQGYTTSISMLLNVTMIMLYFGVVMITVVAVQKQVKSNKTMTIKQIIMEAVTIIIAISLITTLYTVIG